MARSRRRYEDLTSHKAGATSSWWLGPCRLRRDTEVEIDEVSALWPMHGLLDMVTQPEEVFPVQVRHSADAAGTRIEDRVRLAEAVTAMVKRNGAASHRRPAGILDGDGGDDKSTTSQSR